MKPLVAILIALAAPLAAQDDGAARPKPAEGAARPACYCANRGERVELGETACLRVDGRRFTARCAMSLNNPVWREERDGCDPVGLSLTSPPASARPARG